MRAGGRSEEGERRASGPKKERAEESSDPRHRQSTRRRARQANASIGRRGESAERGAEEQWLAISTSMSLRGRRVESLGG